MVVQVACSNGKIINEHQQLYQNPFQNQLENNVKSILEIMIKMEPETIKNN
jgi:hypothetical protein